MFLAAGFLVTDDIASGRLVPLLADDKPVASVMNVAYPHRHYLSAKARTFMDQLAQHSTDRQRMMIPNR